MPEHRQCIVVGAGLLGLATAWSLARRGRDVLVLEAAEPGHGGAGSAGEARIFRLSYPDPFYVQMARDALDRWRILEAESGETLLHRMGLLNFGDGLADLARTMAGAGAAGEHLSPTETAARFPGLHIAGPSLLESTGGVLAADGCLRALRQSGSFELRTDTEVRRLRDEGDRVAVTLGDGAALSAGTVVNCAGHHALALLSPLRSPVAAPASLQQVVYLAPTGPERSVPPFIEWGPDTIYGLPAPGSGTFKLSHHKAGPPLVATAGETDDDRDLLELLGRAAHRLLPGWDPTPVATERCPYDNTSDSDFIIDRVGRIVIGCGTSGHGFKFGPLLGELLADLATGAEPRFGLGRFAIDRPAAGALAGS